MNSQPLPTDPRGRIGVVILAGGLGRRMWPFGEVRNKSALPVCTRPLLAWVLEAVAGLDVIGEVVVVTGHQPGSVRDAAREARTGALPIRFVAGGRSAGGLGGTADGAWVGLQSLGEGCETALLLLGDCWFEREDLERLCHQGLEATVPTLLVGHPRAPQLDPRTGIGMRVEGGRVSEVLMHPREELGWRWLGAVVLPRTCFEELGAVPEAVDQVEVGAMPPTGAELAQWMGKRAENGSGLLACDASGLACDLDRPWDWLWLNAQCTHRMVLQAADPDGRDLGPGATIDPSAHVEGPIRLGRGSRIGLGAIVRGGLWAGDEVEITDGAVLEGPIVVGDRTRIERYCQVGPETVLGCDCRIGHGAEVQGLFLNRFYAYHYCEFWGICGTAVDLGAATVCGNLRFDDRFSEHVVLKRRETPEYGANAAYLGDYSRTGVNAILLPGVKLGVYCLVGPGTMISGDIPNRCAVYVEQTVTKKDWGPDRYAW